MLVNNNNNIYFNNNVKDRNNKCLIRIEIIIQIICSNIKIIECKNKNLLIINQRSKLKIIIIASLYFLMIIFQVLRTLEIKKINQINEMNKI